MGEIKGLVSVTIPFYNAERFLGETIESVIAQTYPEWELLLVDDGSTDGSTRIAMDYAARSGQRIRYLEHAGHSNRGVNCSRNLGAREGHGEFVAFLDSDDIWMPQKLEDHVAAMEAHREAGMMFDSTEYWYDWTPKQEIEGENHIPPLAPGDKVYFPPHLLANSYPLGPYGCPCPSSFLLRRSAFESIGGFDECFNPQTYQMYEDVAFLAKAYLSIPVFVSNNCLDKNRCSRFSMTHSLAGASRDERARRYYFQWLRHYLRQHKIVDPQIWRTVRRQSWFYWAPLPTSCARLLRRASNKIYRMLKPDAR